MTDPERALQAAILARLKSDGASTAVLGGRIWDQPPGDGHPYEYPHLLFSRCETRPLGADGGEYEHRLTLTAVSRYGGSEEAKRAAAAVRAALDGASLSPSGWRCVSLTVTFSDTYRAADLRTSYGVLRLRAVTEAA